MDAEQRRQRDELIERLKTDEPVVLETDPMPNGHHVHDDVEIPIAAIVGRLGRRIGELEADLAFALAHAEAATAELQQARLALLEAQLRETTKEHADG